MRTLLSDRQYSEKRRCGPLFQKSPAAASHKLVSIVRFLSLASYVVLLLLVLDDWIISSADPYPYLASALTTLAAVTGPALILLYRIPNRFNYALLGLAAIAVVWQGWSELRQASDLALVVAAAVTLLLSAANRNQGHPFTRVSAVYILATSGIALSSLVLFPRPSPLISNDSWLGVGLGTQVRGTEDAYLSVGLGPYGTNLAAEQGLLMLIALWVVLVCSFVVGALVLLYPTGWSDTPARKNLASTGIGALFGLLVIGLFAPPFMTINSVAGTWALALSMAAIGIAASPSAHSTPSPSEVLAKSLRTSRKTLALTGLASAIGAVVLAAYLLALRPLIKPFVAGTPARYASFTPLSQISQPMQDATIAMEDGHFYDEEGFDWKAMHRALRIDLSEGRIVEGGSTITQQLAKNLFLTKDRTIARKLREAAFTIDLNAMLPKRRILELYLNTIDYGMGCHGITSAAAYYFHTTPAKLTLAQSAVLVGMVPDPPQSDQQIQAKGEAQLENLGKLSEGEQTALGRVSFFFPGRYSEDQIDQAQSIPLDRTIYPWKDAYDRGATQSIPATWHGASFYYLNNPDTASQINYVAPCLMDRFGPFLDEARKRFGVVGIDHLGVYNDRSIRGSNAELSAHAYGQAIDISGFRFTDGSQVLVKDHGDPRVLARLAPLEALLKRHFDLVIDWRDDPVGHQTHFHCEVKGPRPPILPTRGQGTPVLLQ